MVRKVLDWIAISEMLDSMFIPVVTIQDLHSTGAEERGPRFSFNLFSTGKFNRTTQIYTVASLGSLEGKRRQNTMAECICLTDRGE